MITLYVCLWLAFVTAGVILFAVDHCLDESARVLTALYVTEAVCGNVLLIGSVVGLVAFPATAVPAICFFAAGGGHLFVAALMLRALDRQ